MLLSALLIRGQSAIFKIRGALAHCCENAGCPSNLTPSRQIPLMLSKSVMSFRGFPSTSSKSALRPGTILPLSVHPNRSAIKLVVARKTSAGERPALFTSRYISTCRLVPKTRPGAPAAASEPLACRMSAVTWGNERICLPDDVYASRFQLAHAVDGILPFCAR